MNKPSAAEAAAAEAGAAAAEAKAAAAETAVAEDNRKPNIVAHQQWLHTTNHCKPTIITNQQSLHQQVRHVFQKEGI